MNYINRNHYSCFQLTTLVVLRVLVGWYFLYEGLTKLLSPGWTAYGYLLESNGLFAPIFKGIAANPGLLAFADAVNVYGLTIVGLLLVLGLFEKVGYIGAAGFLLLYYLAHPPLLNVEYLFPTEGSYLWVDRNLIMLATVIVMLAFPTGKEIGLDRLIFRNKREK